MKRPLLRSSAYTRATKRLLKKHPEIAGSINATLELLLNDASDPRLKTHKLTGELAGSWSCSAGYDLRIVFEFVDRGGTEAILLQNVGTHDEVY